MLHLDGELALYDRSARVVWSTLTGGHPGGTLTVGEEGVELRAPDGALVWSVRAAPEVPVAPFLSWAAPSAARSLSVPGLPMARAVPAARTGRAARRAVPAGEEPSRVSSRQGGS